jgi:hypothetical protein
MQRRDEKKEAETWELLYGRVARLLEEFGREDSDVPGDYSIHDSYWGFPQLKISVNSSMIDPSIIKRLQEIIADFPGWEIVLAVVESGEGESWPDMGLVIRKNELLDGLKRQYLPKKFQHLRYEGSRPMTDRDWRF